MTVSEFTAVTDCPKCGAWDLHWIDIPAPKPTSEDWLRYNTKLTAWELEPAKEYAGWEHVQAFNGDIVKIIPPPRKKPRPRQPKDESMFSSMRVCRVCEHRWGQK